MTLHQIMFAYRNYKGERAVRTIIPDALEFIRDPGFGYQSGWFISGLDVFKQQRRSFALSHIEFPSGSRAYSLILAAQPLDSPPSS